MSCVMNAALSMEYIPLDVAQYGTLSVMCAARKSLLRRRVIMRTS